MPSAATADARLAEVGTRQYGAFHRDQAVEAGLSRRQLDGRIASGRVQRRDHNVYVFAGVPPSPEQALIVAVLASGGAASHRSAAWLEDLISGHPPRPEITIPSNRNYRAPGVVVRRQQDVGPEHLTVVRGIRCTDVKETLLSLGIAVPQALHERALDRALHRGLVEYGDLVSYYFTKARQGRDGCGKLHELFCLRDPEMPPAASDLETLLMRVIRDHGLPIPERQVPVTIGERHVRFDLAYPGPMIALEGDGFGIHTLRGMFETDRSRHNAVTLAGWLTVHFTWRMIIHDPAYIVATIAEALRSRDFSW